MRIYPLSILAVISLSSTSTAFNPRTLTLTKRGVAYASTAVPTIEEKCGQGVEQGLLHHEGHNLIDYTNLILDTEKNPPGSLNQDVVNAAFPILWTWGRRETKEAAVTVERLLDRFEQEVEAGNEPLQLSHKHYTVAVDAWGKSGHEDSAGHAERILHRMVEMAKTKPWLAPTRVTFNALMNAYSKQGDTERAHEILVQMETSATVQPITSDYNVLLGAYARLGEARDAENVLKMMVDRCKLIGDPCECAPDLYSYNMLLDAWAKSSEPGRGKRAETILAALLEQQVQGELPFEPDARTYSSAICAIVRSNEPNAIKRTQEILARAETRGIEADEYLQTALLDAYASSEKPGSAEKAEKILDKLEADGTINPVAYNTVMKAWKESNHTEASSRAEAILRRMEKLNIADCISYSTLIALYANMGSRSSAQHAEEMAEKMKEAGARPNTQTLNAVMNAWIRCGDIRHAERILNRMEHAYQEGAGDIVPTVVSYSTIMNGWAKSRNPQAANKAEEVFRRMRVMYESGNDDAQPNMFSYATLINAIVKSRQPGAASRAEQVLFEMYDQYKQSTNKSVKPNTMLVTAVIDCWQKSGERDAGEKAETLLDWLMGLYEKEQDEDFRPNEFTFGAAISAWAKSRKFGKAARARAVLEKMIRWHESGDIRAKPNAHCYTAVISSCAYCENDDFERRDALQIAVETYKELVESDHEGPNQVTFSSLITVLRNNMPECEKRSSAVSTIFRKCAEDGHVEDSVVQRLQTALNTQELQDLLGTAVSEDGKINMNDIPSEWKRNCKIRPSYRKNPISSQRP